MKRFYYQFDCTLPRLKKLQKWVKMHAKFGAYMHALENESWKYDVELFCPPVHTDSMGNRALIGTRSPQKRVESLQT